MNRTIRQRLFTRFSKATPGGADKTVRRARDLLCEPLEERGLMTAGSVVLSPGLVTITPATTGPTVAIVSYQKASGSTMLDVNLNGVDHDFTLAQVAFVYYRGTGSSGAQTFENLTSLHTIAWGGSGTNLFISAGNAQDVFYGGAGANTFDAGGGFDDLIGGTGTNVFNESATGSGVIVLVGANNTINQPIGATGSYQIL